MLKNILFYISVFLVTCLVSIWEFIFGFACSADSAPDVSKFGCEIYSVIVWPIILINFALFISSFFLIKSRWIILHIMISLCILSGILMTGVGIF